MSRAIWMVVGAVVVAVGAGAAWAGTVEMNNGAISVRVVDGGLAEVRDLRSGLGVSLTGDHSVLTVDGKVFDTAALGAGREEACAGRFVVSWGTEAGELKVVYEIRPGARFVSKQVILEVGPDSKVKVESVGVVDAQLAQAVVSERRLAGGKRGAFVRLGNGGAVTHGLVAVVQNPFMQWGLKDGRMSMAYAPAMEWRGEWGRFEADRACVGVYVPSGHTLPEGMIGEWKYVQDVDGELARRPRVDYAEVEALTDIYRAFLTFKLGKTTKIHVGWCDNDYQIDVGTAEGRTEYKRIIDQAAAVGVNYILYAPANSEVSSLAENRDAWGWENLLWLGMGQKIRKDEWKIETDPIPGSIREMLDYARGRNIGLVAYAYPTVPFMQNPEWTAWIAAQKQKPGGYLGPDTGIRSFQDWWVDRLLAFQKRTGLAGYSFDHWWMAYDKSTTSQYAQWWGTRRVLQELRRRSPEIVIDGRQQYHWFGSWTWLAGTYPHPMMTDEQPGSYENFADLHFSRVSGDRQRYAAYMYRMQEFCPVEILPGYMTHQVPRINDKHECPRGRFRAKNWDYLGWKYSVICSIGTAPMQNVVNVLPARDEQEYAAFLKADQQWLKRWLDWTDENQAVLKRMRSIIGPPAVGRMDGTAACLDDRGFVFLFNPNYREVAGEFRLDGSIGLSRGEKFVLRQLYPRPGVVVGKKAEGAWSFGDTVKVSIKGPEAMVLEVVPLAKISAPVVMGVSGEAKVNGGELTVSGVMGEAGRKMEMQVLLTDEAKVEKVSVNGRAVGGFTQSGRVVSVPLSFAGTAVSHCQQVGAYDPAFAGRIWQGELVIPAAVMEQLAARKKAWPVESTEEDLRCTWLAPHRLLLYVNIADPDHKSDVSLEVNGKAVALTRAFSSIATDAEERTFTGFYADISDLKADTKYALELSLPELKPGQFQGVFLENVETVYTGKLAE